jgi:hypothetical protein
MFLGSPGCELCMTGVGRQWVWVGGGVVVLMGASERSENWMARWPLAHRQVGASAVTSSGASMARYV